MAKTLVVIESPFAGKGTTAEEILIEQRKNVLFAERCCMNACQRGEIPFASHLFFARFLDDSYPLEREVEIEGGLAITKNFHKTAVYLDRGLSFGMKLGINRAVKLNREVELRTLQRTDVLQDAIDFLDAAIREQNRQPDPAPVEPGLYWHRKKAEFYVVTGETVIDATNGHGHDPRVHYFNVRNPARKFIREREEFLEDVADLTNLPTPRMPRFAKLNVNDLKLAVEREFGNHDFFKPEKD